MHVTLWASTTTFTAEGALMGKAQKQGLKVVNPGTVRRIIVVGGLSDVTVMSG